MTKTEKKIITETYDGCLKAVEEYKLSEEGGDLINKGWIEALEFVLQIANQKAIKKPTKAEAYFKRISK